jgi:hypothetical protein
MHHFGGSRYSHPRFDTAGSTTAPSIQDQPPISSTPIFDYSAAAGAAPAVHQANAQSLTALGATGGVNGLANAHGIGLSYFPHARRGTHVDETIPVDSVWGLQHSPGIPGSSSLAPSWAMGSAAGGTSTTTPAGPGSDSNFSGSGSQVDAPLDIPRVLWGPQLASASAPVPVGATSLAHTGSSNSLLGSGFGASGSSPADPVQWSSAIERSTPSSSLDVNAPCFTMEPRLR